MKNYKKIALVGLLSLGAFSLNAQTAEVDQYKRNAKVVPYGPNVKISDKSSLDSKIVDFDGDGNLDRFILTNQPLSNKSNLYLCSNFGKRGSKYVHLVSVPINHESGPSLDLADLDNDGDLDVIVSSKTPFSSRTDDYLFEHLPNHKLKNVKYFR